MCNLLSFSNDQYCIIPNNFLTDIFIETVSVNAYQAYTYLAYFKELVPLAHLRKNLSYNIALRGKLSFILKWASELRKLKRICMYDCFKSTGITHTRKKYLLAVSVDEPESYRLWYLAAHCHWSTAYRHVPCSTPNYKHWAPTKSSAFSNPQTYMEGNSCNSITSVAEWSVTSNNCKLQCESRVQKQQHVKTTTTFGEHADYTQYNKWIVAMWKKSLPKETTW